MFLNLAKGQEDLKALILKDKNKKKRPVGVLNLGRSFKGPVRQVSELATPSRERERDNHALLFRLSFRSNPTILVPSRSSTTQAFILK